MIAAPLWFFRGEYAGGTQEEPRGTKRRGRRRDAGGTKRNQEEPREEERTQEEPRGTKRMGEDETLYRLDLFPPVGMRKPVRLWEKKRMPR